VGTLIGAVISLWFVLVIALSPSFESVTGIASWGYFEGHVVTRYPRGTLIRVCGPLTCWRGRSWGYGPDPRTKRIADLDRSVFARLCGPPSRGLCRVTLTAWTSH
jgi:hypothetical protein